MKVYIISAIIDIIILLAYPIVFIAHLIRRLREGRR